MEPGLRAHTIKTDGHSCLARPDELAQNRCCLGASPTTMDKRWPIARDPLPRLLLCAAGAISLVPLEIPDSRHIVDLQMSNQSVAQMAGPYTTDEQDILVLIAQDVYPFDRRNIVQVAGVPSLRLLNPGDHMSLLFFSRG